MMKQRYKEKEQNVLVRSFSSINNM